MSENILSVESLRKSYGSLRVTDGLDLAVRTGEVHALIGPNGAGKTTLMAQLFGEVRPDSGRIVFDGVDICGDPVHRRVHRGMARSYQITSVYPEFTAQQNVAMAIQSISGTSFRFLRDASRVAALTQPAQQRLDQVGLGGRTDTLAGNLAHGEKRQLELAMALAGQPRLLLLDEPMAGLGKQETQEMLAVLMGLKGQLAILLVEHDMDAVFALADRITVLVYGKAIATGTPAEIRANAAVRAAYLGED